MADRPDDCDPVAPHLVYWDLYWSKLGAPGHPPLHPEVAARLVEVDDVLSSLHLLGQPQREVADDLGRLLCCLLVLVLDYDIADLVLVVELAQALSLDR